MLTQIIVLAHEPLAQAFRAVAAHALGENHCALVQAVWLNVPENEAVADTVDRIQNSAHQGAVLVMSDLAHATPHNCGLRFAQLHQSKGFEVQVFPNSSIAHIMRAITNASLPLAQLSAKLQST